MTPKPRKALRTHRNTRDKMWGNVAGYFIHSRLNISKKVILDGLVYTYIHIVCSKNESIFCNIRNEHNNKSKRPATQGQKGRQFKLKVSNCTVIKRRIRRRMKLYRVYIELLIE